MKNDWFTNLNVAITVCDNQGTILEMNQKAATTFQKWGGQDLIGKNLMDCHNPNSQQIIEQLIKNNGTNCYTIEKEGKKKLIYQTSWPKDGPSQGLVEFSFEIPENMPHFKR